MSLEPLQVGFDALVKLTAAARKLVSNVKNAVKWFSKTALKQI